MQDRPLKDIIGSWLQDPRVKEKLTEAKLLDKWGDIVGAVIAQYTRRIYVSDRKLYVQLDSPVLKHELHLGRAMLLRNINEYLGDGFLKEVIIQ